MTLPDDAPTRPPLESPLIRALLMVSLLAAGLAMWLHFGAIEWAYGAQLAGVGIAAALAIIILCGRLVTSGFTRIWKSCPHSRIDRVVRLVSIALVVPLVMAARLSEGIGRGLVRLRHLTRRTRWIVALAIFVTSGAVLLYLNFIREQSDLHPSVCDEYSYLVQAQLIAHGRLWSPPHDQPEFFTTFQVIADPVYASIYFPGTALWLAPWARLAPDGSMAWIGTWLAASLAVMLLYLVTAELVDDLAGMLAALLAFAVPIWRGLAMVIMGQCIAAMLGLLVVWLFLRWRGAARRGHTRSALAWGAAAGFVATWAMLTRPVDGLAYSLPVVIGVIAAGSVPAKLRALSMAAAIAGVLPLAGAQLAFNNAVSGGALQTPFSWYNNKYLPGTTYGEEDRNPERMKQIPHTAHFHHSYQTFTRDFVEKIGTEPLPELARERLRMTTVAGTTHGMTLTWVPFALLLLLPRRGLPDPAPVPDRPASPPRVGGWDLWLLAAPFPLMWLLYLPYGFYLYQYAGAAVPTMAFWMAAGAIGIWAYLSAGPSRATTPAPRWEGEAPAEPVTQGADSVGPLAYQPRERGVAPWWQWGVLVFAVGALLSLATRGIPGFFPTQSEDWYRVPELRQIDQILGDIPHPAVVFITPPGGDSPPEADAVYNLGVVFPDAARVVRAHDLAERNVDLVAYYAQQQPQRRMYHYHRRARQLTDLGTAAELDARPREELEAMFSSLSLPWRRRYAALLAEYGYDAEEMPFTAPPQSEWALTAEDPPPGSALEPATRRFSTREKQ